MQDLAERSPSELDRPKGGRPKGSKNKITLMKLMAEEAVRSKQIDKMLAVCEKIIEDALEGDQASRKLVWSSIMSKSGIDHNAPSGAMPEIIIRSDHPPLIRTVNQIDVTPEEPENG